jgi:dipeptidyl aminopeptidase/acylaminoacyl peptidase
LKAAFALFLLPVASLAAQAPPGTDIFVMSLDHKGGVMVLGPAVNITARPGYDNQPFFSIDGASVYYTSQRGGQTDIYRYDLAAGISTQVTRTRENEYSPTITPDGKHFSVIRDSLQFLWSFSLDGTPAATPLLDSIRPVGYHTWLNADTVFVFVLGTPATLRRAELAHGTAAVVASDIGRALLKVPGRRAISYAQRDSTRFWVRVIDPVTGQGESLVRLPEGNEFFTWMPDGSLLSASGNRLLGWRPGEKDWTEIARFTEPGLQQISRLAVSPSGDRLALVGGEPAVKAP